MLNSLVLMFRIFRLFRFLNHLPQILRYTPDIPSFLILSMRPQPQNTLNSSQNRSKSAPKSSISAPSLNSNLIQFYLLSLRLYVIRQISFLFIPIYQPPSLKTPSIIAKIAQIYPQIINLSPPGSSKIT